MDSRIVKKMNEIIGALKIIERELANQSITEEKQRLMIARKPLIEQKMMELEEMMATIMADAQTINLHKRLKDEVAKTLSVSYFPKTGRFF